MTWNSSYNEALCSLCVLGALALFIRFSETGRRSLWVGSVCRVHHRLRSSGNQYRLPRTGGSLGALPRPFGKPPEIAPVAVPTRVDVRYLFRHPPSGRPAARLRTLPTPCGTRYGEDPCLLLAVDGAPQPVVRLWTFPASCSGGDRNRIFGHRRHTVDGLASKSRHSGVLHCLVCYLACTEFSHLSAHRTDYYLTIPLFGFALAAALGISWAWSKGVVWGMLAALPSVVYLGAMVPIAWAQTLWWEARAENVRVLVLGVQAAKKAHPNRAIVLDGITSFLYDDAVGQSAFYPIGIDDVYLTPGSELNIHPGGEMADIRSLVLEPSVMYHALTHDQIVIYSRCWRPPPQHYGGL